MIEAPDESYKVYGNEMGGNDMQTFSDFNVPQRLFGTTFKKEKRSVKMVFAERNDDSHKEVGLDDSFKRRLLEENKKRAVDPYDANNFEQRDSSGVSSNGDIADKMNQ